MKIIITYTTETNGGVTHTRVLGDLDHGVGHLGRVWATGDWSETALDGLGDLLALDGLEWGLATLLDA